MELHASDAEVSIVVVGLARDCAPALAGTLAFCEALEKFFPKIDFVFGENSSKDATGRLLKDWSSRQGNATVFHPNNIADKDSRTQRIAACRNAAKDLIEGQFPNAEFLLILDMDLDLGPRNAESVSNAIKFIQDNKAVSAVFPNSRPLYYDLFALRHPFWCPTDVWQEVDRAWREWRTDDDHQTPPEDLYVRSRQLSIPTDLPPIKVDSAFGGLGIYRWDAARTGCYRGVDDDGRPTCEHVEFHKRVSGEKYILPSWCIEAPHEHLSSAFRTEYPHERELRRRRSRIAFREKMVRKWPALRPVLNWAIR